MAKSSYKIPASIDRSHLDHEIVIEFWDIKLKPVTIKVLLYWFAVLGVLVWTVLQSPLSHAGIGWRVLFALWFIPQFTLVGSCALVSLSGRRCRRWFPISRQARVICLLVAPVSRMV